MTKPRPLSQSMIHALFCLRTHQPFGLDRRTENALYWRGLAVWVPARLYNRATGRYRKIKHLRLSSRGRELADGLHVQRLVESGAIPVKNGLAIIDGGKPITLGRIGLPWPGPGTDAA